MKNVHCLKQDLYQSNRSVPCKMLLHTCTWSNCARMSCSSDEEKLLAILIPSSIRCKHYGASSTTASQRHLDRAKIELSSFPVHNIYMHVRMRAMVTSLEISKWVGLLVYPLAFELHDQKVGGAACRLDCFWVVLCARNQGKCVYLWTSIPKSVS